MIKLQRFKQEITSHFNNNEQWEKLRSEARKRKEKVENEQQTEQESE